MDRIIKTLSILVLLSLPIVSVAQLLTIHDAVGQAIENNAQINQMRAELRQKQAEWRIQSGIAAPEFSYMKEGMGDKSVNPFQERRMTVSQSTDFPLTMYYRAKGLIQEGKAKELIIKSEERRVKSEVKSRYIEVLYALHLQRSKEEQLKLATGLYNAVYTRFETGMGNGMDLIKAEVQVAEANNDIADAKRQLHLARYGLFKLMGLDPDNQKYSIQFSDTLHVDDVGVSQVEALAVLEKQPLYQSATMEMSASSYFLKEAKSNVLPDIRFDLYKQDLGGGYKFNGFEVGLSFPLWFPLEQRGKIKANLARQDQIRWKQEEIKLGMKEQVERAWHGYEASKETINRYNETIRDKAEKLQSLALNAFRLGELDLLNLIQAQQIYLGSHQRYLTALRDYYIQLAELERFVDKDLVY